MNPRLILLLGTHIDGQGPPPARYVRVDLTAETIARVERALALCRRDAMVADVGIYPADLEWDRRMKATTDNDRLVITERSVSIIGHYRDGALYTWAVDPDDLLRRARSDDTDDRLIINAGAPDSRPFMDMLRADGVLSDCWEALAPEESREPVGWGA